MKKYHFSNSNTAEFYEKNGFALFPNLFSPEEIKTIRENLVSKFASPSAFDDDNAWDEKGGGYKIRFDLFNRYPELRWILFKPELKQALNTILGDFGIVTESVAHYEGFGFWHKDTTSQERLGESFHYDADYNMVQCAIYLQDNDPVFGGGLDVVPGTHREKKDNFVPRQKRNFVNKILNSFHHRFAQRKANMKGVQLMTKAGDFVLFNQKTIHRASLCHESAKPEEKLKYALFFIAGANNRHLQDYTDHIKRRYDYMAHYVTDKDFKESCKEHNIELITPD